MGKRNGGAVAKLTLKVKTKSAAFKMGTHKPMIARTTTPHHDKRTAFIEHQRNIHGHVVRGVVVREGGHNPGAAECFRGDGLPDEVIIGSKNWVGAKPPKSAAERAAEDKRAPLKGEMVEGWKPRRYVSKWMKARGL